MTVRGHACKSDVETALCKEMGRQRLPHEHRSLQFRVLDGRGGSKDYSPAIVARRGPILFLVEPVDKKRGMVDLLQRFLEQHSPEIVHVVVAPVDLMDRIPHGAYDEIYAASDLGGLTTRIREQDPEGIVRPFEKPRPR